MPRFTIRDLLWLTIVVGLAIANWLERRSHAAAIHDLKHEVQVRELAAQALVNETNMLAGQDSDFIMELDDAGQTWRWTAKPQ